MGASEGLGKGQAIRIHHVSLTTPAGELERAIELWRLVGFEPVESPEGLRDRARWLEAGAGGARVQIHLLPEEDGADAGSGGEAGERGQSAIPARTADHVALVAADWERTCAALREAGFEVADRTPYWGAARALVAHPGGHIVELMAAPPPES